MTAACAEGAGRGRFIVHRALVGGAALLMLGAARAYAPYATTGPVICPLHGVLGLPCPGCGLTRAFTRLAHGDVLGALGYHALSPLLFLAAALTPLVCALEITRRGPTALTRQLLESAPLGWGLGALVGGHHVVRTGLMLWDGTLFRDYVATSWSYALLTALGLVQ